MNSRSNNDRRPQDFLSLAAQRQIRVFISSTFRDMYAEREELVKQVFPQLRKRCEQRGVTWTDVDLRWGVTDEQKTEGNVLPICLAEIERCQPYFIGVLGERYGPPVDRIHPDVLAREPWLTDHLDHSLTEMEILHGVLRNPAMAEHAFFYFRDPAYLDCLPENTNHADFRSENADQVEKLGRLKARIRESGFPVRENYSDPKALGQLVLADFTVLIDRLYPEGSQPSPLERDAMDQDFYAASRARAYIRRQADFDTLDKHAAGEGYPLVVLGESGVGKSALLANWALEYRKNHPEELIVLHFVGSSPYSNDWAPMVRRIMLEFERRLGGREKIPDQADALRLAFANALYKTAAKGRVVLVLDALNQLEDREGAQDLLWLPPELPVNVRLVVSTLPGKPLEEAKRRRWPTLTVEPLKPKERRELINVYLQQYTKNLKSDQVDRIADSGQAANPLFLRALLEELRLFGVHDELERRIDHYLAANTIPELYDRILARYREDYERDRPGLVQDAFCLVWASRRGLAETELLDLLGTHGQPLQQAIWSPLHLAAEQLFTNRLGLLAFGHNYIRQAVQETWMKAMDAQEASHRTLAGYFERLDIGPRVADELPWQLKEGHEWGALSKLLVEAQPELLNMLWQWGEWQLQEYWTEVEQNSSFRMVSSYAGLMRDPQKDPPRAFIASALLRKRGYTDDALALVTTLSEWCKFTVDQHSLDLRHTILLEYADNLYHRGDLDGAMTILRELEAHCRESNDLPNLAASLGNGALILQVRGKLDEAMASLQESERINRDLGFRRDVAICRGNQGTILRIRGDREGATRAYKDEEGIFRELGDPTGLANSLGKQAIIQRDVGDLNAAMSFHKEEEALHRRLGNLQGLCISIGNQSLLAMDKGDLDESMKLLVEEESLCSRLHDRVGTTRNLNNQAVILRYRGDLDGAMALHKKQEVICREMDDLGALALCLGNQANILAMRRNFNGALRIHAEEERIYLQLKDPSGLALCLGNQAAVLQESGDLKSALDLQKKVEGMYRELGEPEGLARTLYNEAVIFLRQRASDQAYRTALEAHTIAVAHGFGSMVDQISRILSHIASRQR
jgi:tetratricopeptide (TPR) repeat protein